jgi:3-methyladenine DNA glycosylase Tag
MDNTALINKLNNEYEKLERYINNLINTIYNESKDENQDEIKQVIKKLTTKKIKISKDLKMINDYEKMVNKLLNEYYVNT